jgi:hypothetical protein
MRTRLESDLSEVISRRLANYSAGEETAEMREGSVVPSKEKASSPEMLIGTQADRVPDQDKEELMRENRRKEDHPNKPALYEKEAFFQALQQSGVQNSRGRRLFKAVVLILLVIASLGTGYLFSQYAGKSLGTTTSLQGEVLKARKLVICDGNGASRLLLHEQDGTVYFELCDPAGKARAGISLGPDAEPKFCLYDKDKNKLKEWGWAEKDNPRREIAPQQTAESPDTEKGSPASEIAEPKYIGSFTSNKYHYPSCKWGKQISPEKVLTFHSVKEAQDNGYVQCRACRPPLKGEIEESQQTKETSSQKRFGRISFSSAVKE